MTENKRFNVFDVDGTIFLEDHKEGSYHIGEIGNVDVNCLNDIADRLNELAEENEQLKQRNNRQYEQLGRLYDLIEQKEWRVLTDIIDDFKKSDEQLQKEWGTYGDVE